MKETVRLTAPDANSLIDKVIGGKYLILSAIGAGGMSSVFQARDLVINRVVALKILQSLQAEDENAIVRFQKEAMATGRLKHPNIVQLYEVGTHDDGTPYLVMEYFAGDTLSQRLKTAGHLSVTEAIRIFIQVCDAMAYAHENGVIHRDIKPSNLLLAEASDNSDFVKILDFGIAKVWDDAFSGQQKTRTGEIFGSPLYMSPEQASGSTKLDSRTDIYSTGCALFEALCGVPPFVGESTISTLMKHQNEPAPSLKDASLGMEFSPRLEAILARCLSKNSADRFQSMSELQDALKEYLEEPEGEPRAFPNHLERTERKNAFGNSDNSQKRTKIQTVASNSVAPYVIIGGLLLTCLAILGYVLFLNVSHNGAPHAVTVAKGEVGSGSGSEKKLSPAVKKIPGNESSSGSLLPEARTYNMEPSSSEYDQEIASIFEQNPDEDSLRLKSFVISSRGLKTIGQFKSLRKLNLTGSTFNDLTPEFSALAHLPLSIFSATDTKLSDAGLLTITTNTSLRELNLGMCPNLSDSGFANFSKLQKLEKLEAHDDKISDEALRRIAQCKNLQVLNLNSCRRIRGEPIRELAKSPFMDQLMFNGTGVDDTTIGPIANIGELRALDLVGTRISDAGAAAIARIKGLKFLDLRDTKITDSGLRHFAALHELKELDVTHCHNVSIQALTKLRRALPKCSIFDEVHPKPPPRSST